MRHGKKINHLGRTAPHRKAMLANMASSLLMHKRINTTLAKAKALRTFIEPLLTKSKNDTTHSRRTVFRYLQDKYAVTELFREVAPKIAERPGGYTRILKTGNRLGDNAEMCLIELVDFNEIRKTETKSGAAEKKSRTRRGRGKKEAPAKKPETASPKAEATPKAKAKPVIEDAEIIAEETKPVETKTGSAESAEPNSPEESGDKEGK